METEKKERGDGLINPNLKEREDKKPRKVKLHEDGLMERQENKVLTEDGRELLNS